MLAEEFVDVLRKAAPSRIALTNYGLEPDEVAQILASFECRIRKDKKVEDHNQSQLERLIYVYDCAAVEVASLRLVGAPLRYGEGRIVGHWEADPVVLCDNGRVEAYDHAQPGVKLADCATNGDRFLAALSLVVQARATPKESRGSIAEVASTCAATAGLEGEPVFWASLLSGMS
jgi:hypothetical protein